MPPLPIELVITPEKYTISSCGYDGQIGTGIPQWMINSIQSNINNSLVPMWTTVDQVNTDLATLETGVNQSIFEIETENTSLNGLITTVASRVDGNTAAIVETLTTLATDYDTTATLDVKLASTYDNSTAYFNTNITTYANDIQANATSITSLVAAYNGIEVKITEFDDAFAGISTLWDGQGTADLGQTKFVEMDPIGNPGNLTEFIYVGGTLGPNNDGWLIGGAGNTAAWAAYSSKLITAPDGTVTGWEFADGTNASSEFKISADNIVMNGATTFLSPGDNVTQLANNAGWTTDAVVNALKNNIYVPGTTKIDGGVLQTGTVIADSVDAASITGDHISGKYLTATAAGHGSTSINALTATGIEGGYAIYATKTGVTGSKAVIFGDSNRATFAGVHGDSPGTGVKGTGGTYGVYSDGPFKATGDGYFNSKVYIGTSGAYLYNGSHAGNSSWPHMYIPGLGHFALNGTSS